MGLAKCKERQSHHSHDGCGGDSHRWKETYEMNKQRLSIAEKMTAEALTQTKQLHQQIKKQNRKLKSLREAQRKLQKLEVFYQDIASENRILSTQNINS